MRTGTYVGSALWSVCIRILHQAYDSMCCTVCGLCSFICAQISAQHAVEAVVLRMSQAMATTLDTMTSSAVTTTDAKKLPAAAAVIDVGVASDNPAHVKS